MDKEEGGCRSVGWMFLVRDHGDGDGKGNNRDNRYAQDWITGFCKNETVYAAQCSWLNMAVHRDSEEIEREITISHS